MLYNTANFSTLMSAEWHILPFRLALAPRGLPGLVTCLYLDDWTAGVELDKNHYLAWWSTRIKVSNQNCHLATSQIIQLFNKAWLICYEITSGHTLPICRLYPLYRQKYVDTCPWQPYSKRVFPKLLHYNFLSLKLNGGRR